MPHFTNTEESEVEPFYEDLQDLLEVTPSKDVLFIIGDWNAKVESQKTPGVTDKFGLGIRNEAGQRLIEFCQENTLVIANTHFQQHKTRRFRTNTPKRCPFHYRGLESKSRKSRNTWGNRQIWPWNME